MKISAFNGSPRKKWNTAKLLEKALEGAASKGAETELIHLYDLDFKGCRSCFACKTKGSESYGKCALVDDLTPVLEKIEKTDALILGSPVYFLDVSGEMKSFMERLLYPYLTYDDPPSSLFPKKISTGFIYTMNVTQKEMAGLGFGQQFGFYEMFLQMIFGASETICSYDTYQFKDYSKMAGNRFDPKEKEKVLKEVFPKDCEKAFEMGARFAETEIP